MHIGNTCNSAKQKLGLLYRNFHQAGPKTLSHLYRTLVLPKLNYCSCVWGPHTTSLINSLESVQSFTAKLCTKRWSSLSTDLIQSLTGLPSALTTQDTRFKSAGRHIISHESILPCASYFHPLPHIDPRTQNSQFVSVPFARTTSFQQSFFVSACSLWNSLPDSVITLTSARGFKAALSRLHFLSVCLLFTQLCFTFLHVSYIAITHTLTSHFHFCWSAFTLAVGCCLVVFLQIT